MINFDDPAKNFENTKRQFAFTGATIGSSTTENVVYTCEIKICDKDDETTCSTTNKEGTANTCDARSYYTLGRKRRSMDEETKVVELSKDSFSKRILIFHFFEYFLFKTLVLKTQ